MQFDINSLVNKEIEIHGRKKKRVELGGRKFELVTESVENDEKSILWIPGKKGKLKPSKYFPNIFIKYYMYYK